MSEFEVGNRVKWVWCKSDRFTEYVGKEYTIDEIDVEYEYPYHLKEVDRWTPGDELEKIKEDWEVSVPAQDRFTLTIERFGTDGKKYMSGVADICEVEFYAMWDCYVA